MTVYNIKHKIIVTFILFISLFLILSFFNNVQASNGSEYEIVVHLGSNVAIVYKNGVEYKSMVCSTGTATPTSRNIYIK